MKNKATDLNDHLFMMLEAVSDPDLKGEKLTETVAKAKAMSNVADAMLKHAALILDAKKLSYETANAVELPKTLSLTDERK